MHPALKPFKRCCVGLGLVLAACNVFNPSGEGDAGQSPDALLTDGENYFRQLDYKSAYETFEEAIAADSANSLAYYGYVKSILRYWKVNASALLKELSDAEESGGMPFISADDWTLTRYLQATSRARLALGIWTERDTLTQWYNYSRNPNGPAAAKDPLAAKRIAFMEEYWAKADQGLPGYRKKTSFPLSDLRMGYQRVIADFGVVEFLYTVTQLRDLNGDHTIDSSDNLLKNLTFGTQGGFKVENLEDIVDSLNTPEKTEQFNNLIQNMADGLSSAGTVLKLLSPVVAGQAGADSNGALSESVTQNMDSVITSLGEAVTFYQFGDKRDNDGDGCIDEEIADGKDNDGDLLVDEDARLVPADLVDNDHDGEGSNPVTDPDPAESLNSGFRLIYTTEAGFVTGGKYQDKAYRVAVQKDSLQVRFDAALKAGTEMESGYRMKLDSAKLHIGGCWNNY